MVAVVLTGDDKATSLYASRETGDGRGRAPTGGGDNRRHDLHRSDNHVGVDDATTTTTRASTTTSSHRDRDVADQPEQPSVGRRVERRDAPLEELIADQLRGRPSKHHPTYRSSSNRDQATGSRAASTTTRHDPGEEEDHTRLSATSSNPARSSAGLWRRRRSGQGRQALQPHRAIPIRAGHDPGGVLSFAAGVVVWTGPLGSTRSRGRWATASARAGAPDHRPSNERRPRFRRYGPAPNHPDRHPRASDRWLRDGLPDRGAAAGTLEKSRGRATETVLAPPGKPGATLWPSWSPVVRSAVSAAAPLANLGQLGRSGSSRQPCRRTNVPSRDWRNRHWSRGRPDGSGQVVPRYDPRSVSWGRNPDQAAR